MSKREFANAYKTVRRFIVVAYLAVTFSYLGGMLQQS
jgi:hypothetical protein